MHMFYCVMKGINLCCKFPQLHFYQILSKLVNLVNSYSENQKGEFFETQCIIISIQGAPKSTPGYYCNNFSFIAASQIS